MTARARRIRLAAQPAGALAPADFVLEEIALPVPRSGQVLLRTRFVSLDPYLARAMHAGGGVISGRMIAEVLESGAGQLQQGDVVLVTGPWQDLLTVEESAGRRLDVAGIAASAWIGMLGSPGITAWAGVNRVLAPRAGETVVVSAAAGPVGSVAGQLARLAGARVIGVAGGQEKCDYVRSLGFDACIDHRAGALADALAAAAPSGVDAVFENVGADTLDPVLPLMNKSGRIALCGLFQHYQDRLPVTLANFRMLLDRALRIQGFHVADHADAFALAEQELAAHLRAGRLRYRETVTDGFENTPQAFVNMLAGRGTGKHLVRV